ncbi:MAG: hypothetical protein HC904_12170 [Blastochloris sp.]|nr:hypothetical protein [Blastochloris sp.]
MSLINLTKCKSWRSFLTAGLMMLATGLQASPPNSAEPGPEKKSVQVKEKGKEREGRIKPEPILMAGDPRFQKMLLLATTSPEQLEEKMKDWPRLQEMSEERRASMKKEIESFRSRIFRTAIKSAEENGIVLSEEQKPSFVRRYWEQRAKVESPIRQEVEKRLELAMKEELQALKLEFAPVGAAKP